MSSIMIIEQYKFGLNWGDPFREVLKTPLGYFVCISFFNVSAPFIICFTTHRLIVERGSVCVVIKGLIFIFDVE